MNYILAFKSNFMADIGKFQTI